MNILLRLGFPLLTLGLAGCMGGGASSTPTVVSTTSAAPLSAPAVGRDVIRIGDKITMRLTGVPDEGWILEVQIPESGDVTVPLLTRPFHAVGLTPADLASQIELALKDAKLYTTPNVIVLPEERFVNMGGEVRGPSRVAYTPDLTLLSAINSCGGFTEYANKRAVRIIRGQQVITVDASAANKTPGADPPLYPGDQVYVPRTLL